VAGSLRQNSPDRSCGPGQLEAAHRRRLSYLWADNVRRFTTEKPTVGRASMFGSPINVERDSDDGDGTRTMKKTLRSRSATPTGRMKC
jgi:hypothetical protein